MGIDFKLKQEFLVALLEQVDGELSALRASVAQATDEATHEESKAEGKYDTRAIEAGYLAGAQASRLEAYENQKSVLEQIVAKTKKAYDVVGYGALVAVSTTKGDRKYLFLPFFAGYRLTIEGKECMTLSDQSVLGKTLKGLKVGDGEEYLVGKEPIEIEVTAII